LRPGWSFLQPDVGFWALLHHCRKKRRLHHGWCSYLAGVTVRAHGIRPPTCRGPAVLYGYCTYFPLIAHPCLWCGHPHLSRDRETATLNHGRPVCRLQRCGWRDSNYSRIEVCHENVDCMQLCQDGSDIDCHAVLRLYPYFIIQIASTPWTPTFSPELGTISSTMDRLKASFQIFIHFRLSLSIPLSASDTLHLLIFFRQKFLKTIPINLGLCAGLWVKELTDLSPKLPIKAV